MRPEGAGPARGRTALRCSDFAAAQNSLRSRCSLRSDRLREVSLRGALRALLQSPPLLDAPHGKSTRLAAHCRVNALAKWARWSRHEARLGVCMPMRSEACGARSRERTARSGGAGGRARSAHQRLTSRSLFERSGCKPRSEFCASPPDRAPQRTPGAARGAGPGSHFLPQVLWAKPKKAGRPSGRDPTPHPSCNFEPKLKPWVGRLTPGPACAKTPGCYARRAVCLACVCGEVKVSGLAPTGDPPSLVSPKEPGARNATRGGRPGLRPDCSAVLGLCSRAKLAAFALLTTLRQVARSQSTWGAARPAAKSCAPRRPPRGIVSARCALPGQCLAQVVAVLDRRLRWGCCHADAQRGVWGQVP